MSQPRALIIAGPNGAGKTTFACEFLPNEAGLLNFLNADLIAAGLSPFRPEDAALQATRVMAEAIRQSVEHRVDFCVETNLAGHSYSSLIPAWRKAGYRVSLLFLRLPSAEMAIERVRCRVLQGGHHVPEATVRRRFALGWSQFVDVYRPLADFWQVFDSSAALPRLLESARGDQRDDYLRQSLAALLRAAQRARKLAEYYGTPLALAACPEQSGAAAPGPPTLAL